MDGSIASVTTPPAQVRWPAESAQRIDPPSPAASLAPDFAKDSASGLRSRMLAERSVERDAATGSLVYRLIDVSTGFVTIQTPTDARLKLRAYIDGVIATASSQRAVEVTA